MISIFISVVDLKITKIIEIINSINYIKSIVRVIIHHNMKLKSLEYNDFIKIFPNILILYSNNILISNKKISI